MKNKVTILAAFVALSFAVSAQENTVKVANEVPQSEILLKKNNKAAVNEKKVDNNDIYTGLKPADGLPAVFNSREQLETKVKDKKDNILALIKENAKDPVKVKAYREELWRLENAMVVDPKTQH
jgi:hypothetical protein